MNIFLGVAFLVLFAFLLKGAWLIVSDKQKEWNDKQNKDK